VHPDLPKTIVIHSWRGQESLATAAKQGYSGLLSFGYYIDLMWPAARHYAVDPMSDAAATLSLEEKSRILGGRRALTEWVTPEILDSACGREPPQLPSACGLRRKLQMSARCTPDSPNSIGGSTG